VAPVGIAVRRQTPPTFSSSPTADRCDAANPAPTAAVTKKPPESASLPSQPRRLPRDVEVPVGDPQVPDRPIRRKPEPIAAAARDMPSPIASDRTAQAPRKRSPRRRPRSGRFW
jgi:hypothetical protein